MSESEIQKLILQWLKMKSIFHYRSNNIGVPTGKIRGGKQVFRPSPVKGLPDICCVYYGQAIYLEVKRPGANTTRNQLDFQHNARKAGAISEIVYSLDDVINLFKKLEIHG